VPVSLSATCSLVGPRMKSLGRMQNRFKSILVVFGTRPEAIKMAPVISRLRCSPGIEVRICVSAQHRQMLDQVLNLFSIQPDYDLDLMRPDQSLAGLTSAIIEGVVDVLGRAKPDLVLVHGDTTTTFAAALASFYQKIPVGHVEAGLRTGNLQAPWPEEMNRRFAGQLAALHFAPTAAARMNLENEKIPGNTIWVTGNTVIDALQDIIGRIAANPSLATELAQGMRWLDNPLRRIVLVTGHRRENFGHGTEELCQALRRLALELDVEIVYPVHPNPNVMAPVYRILDGFSNVHLIEPMEYLPFVFLMSKAYLVITDSGGVQEEAPSLGKPVLVTRDVTERPEAVAAGTVRMVGADASRIFNEAKRLLSDSELYVHMSTAHNPYGDGHASDRIAKVIEGQGDINEFA
jgi:UDP-N-acetylglucosamine 2-epimerase (non-hydrolysing)